MRRCVPLLLALLLAAVGTPHAAAQQLAHQVETAGERVAFTVRFRDAGGQERTLDFALPADRYDQAQTALTPVRAPEVKARMQGPIAAHIEDSRAQWREAITARLQVLAETLPDGVEIDWDFEDGRFQWRLRGRGVDQATLQRHGDRLAAQLERVSHRLNAQRQRALDQEVRQVRRAVLREFNYVADPGLGGRLRPDYAKLAAEQAGLLRPLALEVTERAGPTLRDQFALALAFLQTIPYDELIRRGVDRDGTGFAAPAELLQINRGDCDSKATALAALLHTLAPGVPTAVLLLPGHAVLAAALPPRAGDRTVTLKGRRFVLMEPAGPAVLPVGTLGAQSNRLLDSGEPLSVVWTNGESGA